MKVLGIAIIVLAILVAAVPYFNNCEHDGKHLTLANGMEVPMKCYWTAQAEAGLALPILALGAVMAGSRRRETTRAPGALGAVLGLVVMLLPTYLIGVCTTMTGSCNLVMRPAMLFVGTLIVAVSLAALVVAQRSPNR